MVRNLYAARKSPKTNSFSKRKIALCSQVFTKGFTDWIWKDAKSANPGEVGTLDFDPLFDAQDMKITYFVIGKADDGGVVTVRFKNFGKDEWVKFYLIK